jgi:4-aminobutyrate aminotransferase-like enzyme/Ser/Thr protein kinase RdoA (MazF antagonist)
VSAFSADWQVEPLSPIAEEAAAGFLSERFGVTGTLERLGSNHDCNFRVRSDPAQDGRRDYVLKFFNPVTDSSALLAHCEAIERLAVALPDLRLPRGRSGLDGQFLQTFRHDDANLDSLLLDFVPGEPIMDSRYLAPRVLARLGELAGRVTSALEGFEKPPAARPSMWDLRHAYDVVQSLAPQMPDPAAGQQVLEAARLAKSLIEPHDGLLPQQVIHGDLADNNLVCEVDVDGRPLPVGIIDFGDLMDSWTICELAVACTSVLHHHGAAAASILPAVQAFDDVRRLSDEELEVLWPLVVLRAAVMVVAGQDVVLRDAQNSYASAALDREWRMFQVSTSVPAEVMSAQLRSALGRGHSGRPLPSAGVPLILGLPEDAPVLDLSVTSDDLHSGRWQDDAAEARLVAEVLDAGVPAVLTRHGEHRLTRTRVDGLGGRAATLALGVEVHLSETLAETVAVQAPWSGTVTHDSGEGLTLAHEGLGLVLRGLDTGHSVGERFEVVAGQTLGTVAARAGGPRLEVQLTHLPTGDTPAFVPPDLGAGWLAVCPDPTAVIFGREVSNLPPETSYASLLQRRDRSFATVQEHYFDAPPQIERGWRQHLVDTRGRSYLDMLNNVTVLGHGHPRLSAAVHRQWQRLNTNSRFHYSAVVELSERLSSLLPDQLDTVFLVNSGSEAVDLALRLAWAHTGHQDVVAVAEAYHGWTYASDAISTSIADNPHAVDSRPDWVHTVPAPNSYRGEHRGSDAARYGPDAAAFIAQMADRGRPPAAFVAEPFYGNAGGMALPDGYLTEVYAATRAAGGLGIADEIQVGYGRLGTQFWGFEQQHAVPDILTVAKAMGNGHPLGAVITRRDIADSFRSQGYFFSSAGGSPVSAVVGLTVLDVLRDERLQENAKLVGTHLKRRLETLQLKHPLIGAVHGSGLYLGVEFVRDHDTLEPAAEETAAICERLLELGVVLQPTSERMCVLKIKPPLCLTTNDADRFVDALDDVLTHGW